jgi:hypothetical protein
VTEGQKKAKSGGALTVKIGTQNKNEEFEDENLRLWKITNILILRSL